MFTFHYKFLSSTVEPLQSSLWFLEMTAIWEKGNMFKLMSDPNLTVFIFCILNSGAMTAILWFLVLTDIQNNQYHRSWSKMATNSPPTELTCSEFSAVWFNLTRHRLNPTWLNNILGIGWKIKNSLKPVRQLYEQPKNKHRDSLFNFILIYTVIRISWLIC